MAAPDSEHRRRQRRAALRHALLTRAPIKLTRGRLARVRPGRQFKITQRTIDLPRLPDALCGMTIAHLSDPHVGELITPAHLGPIVDATNALGADLIAVTGDFIDFSNSVLPEVIAAMRRLEAPLGTWFVLGNHDYLDDGDAVKESFAAAGLNLLLDRAAHVDYRDHRIAVGGIDWHHEAAAQHRAIRAAHRGMRAADLSILLAHHPHAFDTARELEIDLTLSGHTHGGQVLISKNLGKKGSIGLANFAFRYTRGLYEKGDCRLFVSSGVGSWFPLRFRCPAEITRLELQNPH